MLSVRMKGNYLHCHRNHSRARGRKGIRSRKLNKDKLTAIRTLLNAKELTVEEIASQYGISRSTLNRMC
jgi:DNA invertase Pin-like site-specific DNA recombinase